MDNREENDRIVHDNEKNSYYIIPGQAVTNPTMVNMSNDTIIMNDAIPGAAVPVVAVEAAAAAAAAEAAEPGIPKQVLQILFFLDLTGSMGPWIYAAREQIKTVITMFLATHSNFTVEVGFVGYRDYDVKPEMLTVVYDFTQNIDEFIEFISDPRTNPIGGGDTAESVSSGFEKVLQMPWSSNPKDRKMIFWIADAPCHGPLSGNEYDYFKEGDPNGMDPKKQIEQLRDKNISINFVQIMEKRTKIMIDALKIAYDTNKPNDIVSTSIFSIMPFVQQAYSPHCDRSMGGDGWDDDDDGDSCTLGIGGPEPHFPPHRDVSRGGSEWDDDGPAVRSIPSADSGAPSLSVNDAFQEMLLRTLNEMVI